MTWPARIGRSLRLVAAVIGLGLLAGCITPATGADSYVAKAQQSLKAASSAVATTQLTVRLMRNGRILRSYADETVTSSESALGAISSAFGAVQPPAGTDRLRDRVSTLLTNAEDAVSAARIAVRRNDRAGLAKSAVDLHKAASDLADAQARLS